MKAKLVRMGNSRGVRIPKLLIEQTGLGNEVELTREGGAIVIRPIAHQRDGWAEAFAALGPETDEEMQEANGWPSSTFDEEEWEWR